MSASGPKTKLNQLLKSFADSSASRNNGKTDTNKLIQLSQFIEYLQSLKSEDILSISKGLEEALLTIIITHPQVSNLVYRDLVAQICILNFKANFSKLRDFYINLQDKLQNNRSNSLRLTVLHVMGVLSANFPVLSQFLNETCGILLKTAKSSSLSVRIAIVDSLKNCVIGAEQGIRYAIADLMRLCEKIGRDRDSRVRVALSAVILLMSHYYPDHLKEYISLIRKQCNVKHHNVRHAFGDILGKILARTIPADTETAKRESRRRQQEREQKEAAQNRANGKGKSGKAHGDNDIDSDDDSHLHAGKSDDSSLAASIIDFESGFFAALTLFDKLRSSTSGVSKNSSWFGLTSGTQLLMSFLKECMLLSRFESTRLSYVIKNILKKLKISKSKSSQGKDGGKAKHLRNMGKMMMMKSREHDALHGLDVDDGVVSCMSYVLRYGLFKYLDESSQSKSIAILCEFITHREKKRNRGQIYLCLNEIGYILHSLQCGIDEQINNIFLMCLRFTTYTSHAIRNRAAQCLALCAVSNSDQVFVWADGLIKEISATLSTIDSSDPSKMYLLHGRSIALSEIIKIIPQLTDGVPDSVACKAFSVAVDLFNVDIQEDVSFNLEASSILTVCGWVLVDALIHLGTSWANSKIKTLLNIWRDVFSQTEFTPQTSSEAISLIYVKQAAYHSMLTFVKIFEKQIPIHPDLQTQIVKRLQHALDFEKFINTMIHDKKKPYEHILTPAVRHQLARLRALMMNIFSFLPPTMYERHVTLLKLANANFSHRNAVTSNELEHLLDYEDDILCCPYTQTENTLVSRSCSELNIFIEYISNPTIDELGLDKSWMPQDLMHSVLFQLGIIHDKNQINLHKSTRITAKLADINDATQYDGSPPQIQTISPHLSYSHYATSNVKNDIRILRSMTIGGILMNEDDIESSLKAKQVVDEVKSDTKKEITKEILNKAKLKYNDAVLKALELAQMEQSMRLIPRLTMSYFQKENCDANLRLFCKLFPFQNEQHKLKLVQHFVEVAKDAKQSEKSESLRIVLQNSAAVILGCCKCMLQNGIQFGKGKVRDSVLRIASDFLAFNNALVMRAGAQIFGILSRIEDDAFKHSIIQFLYKKKFGEQKSSIRAASALALGCIHQYSGSKENLGFTVAALQLLEREGNVSLWLLHSLQRILDVVNNPSQVKPKQINNNKRSKNDDDEAICRNILGFTLSILADEKDSVDTRVLNALLQILNTLLSRIVESKKVEPNTNLLNTIIFMLKFIERLNIASLHSKLLECASKIAQCSPKSIVNLDDSNHESNNSDALDAQQYIIHQLQRCLFSGDLREKVSAMDALQTFAAHSPSILVSKNILHSLLYLLDVNATVPIIYHRALSALQAVTSIYGQKYPQSLLAYFRTISLRGMQIKTPEISQIMSLIAQDLAIKKITKSVASDNEWVIIPPSLPCLRYTSLLWIQFVTKSMIDYAISRGGCYMDVRLAKTKVSIQNTSTNRDDTQNSENTLNSESDFEYLILSVPDLVQLVCKDASSKYTVVRNKALQCLHAMIVHFSGIPDPDAGYDGEFLLNQFRAQIYPSIRGIISTESEPQIRFISAEIAVDYMNCPLATEESVVKHFESLFKIFDENPGKHFRHLCGVYEPHVRTCIILSHLKAIAILYNRVYFKHKGDKVPFIKTLKALFVPKLALFKRLTEKALMDYVVVTSSTRKMLRDFDGNFFIGHSYRRVRQYYIASFALLLRSLARLVSSSVFKKTVDEAAQMIENRTAITLFATSLYCLQDCLIQSQFDDDKAELPLVQNACVNLLSTLTSAAYTNTCIDEDMLYDLFTMIHGGIKDQITKNTTHFVWDNDLAQLLLNCAATILNYDLSESFVNLSKLLNVIVNCWIDPINILISYVTTAYDDSPYLNNNDNNNNENKNKIEVRLDESVLKTLIELVELIHKYNLKMSDEQEIDYRKWALQLTDWCNVVTAISMLFSTAYKLSESAKTKSLHFTESHASLCLKLLHILLQFDLYTKPDPNNPNFNLNCMRARGCIAENINYLCHSNTNNTDPHQYYTSVVTMIYDLAHCSMNVEITQEKQDEDEKLNDRQCCESLESLRQFILANIHHETNQKWIIQALHICWKLLFTEIDEMNDTNTLLIALQHKYSSINLQIETMIIILPHIIMILSNNIALFNIHFINALLYVLQIFEMVESVSKRFQSAKTCTQLYSVMIPLLIKYIVDPEHMHAQNDESTRNIIIQYIAQNLGTNNNLLDAIKSLPRNIVAYVQQQLTAFDDDDGSSSSEKTKSKKKHKHKQETDDVHNGNQSQSNGVSKSNANNKTMDENTDEKPKKSKKKKKKGKKKKKKKKNAPKEDLEQNTIDFSAF